MKNEADRKQNNISDKLRMWRTAATEHQLVELAMQETVPDTWLKMHHCGELTPLELQFYVVEYYEHQIHGQPIDV